MKDLRWALAFLTRIPVAPSDSASVPTPILGVWFPVAGLVIGMLVGASYWLCSQLVPPISAAILAVSFGALVTGAFHEDGLADTFDALGGGQDRESVLRIFKDSRLGTLGAAALILSILLRVALLGSLDAGAGFLALVAAHSIGRGLSAATMGFTHPAATGLGKSLMAGYGRGHAIATGALAIAIGTLFVGPATVIGFALAMTIATAVVRWSNGKAGGVTGDVLGAIEQFGEISVLLAVVASVDVWSLPWWT